MGPINKKRQSKASADLLEPTESSKAVWLAEHIDARVDRARDRAAHDPVTFKPCTEKH